MTIVISTTALAASAVALAQNTPYSWTVSKAQVMLQDSANIALPEADRAALDAELTALINKFGPLQLTAQAEYARLDDPKYAELSQTYGTYIYRFKEARANLARGLSIDSAKCAGQGKALKGKRYTRFRCSATSYVLEIPTVELVPGFDPLLPEVAEGPRKVIGPLAATFTVRVLGKSRMVSQRES